MNSFAMSVLAARALQLKMDAEETSLVRLYRQAEQKALEGRSARSRRAVHVSTEVRAVLAHTKVPMRSTRRYSSQYVVQSVAHRDLLLRAEQVHGTHKNFQRIARNHFMTFVRQAESNAAPIRLRSLSDQVTTYLKRLDCL